jgi:hypothetical protein
MRSKIEQKKSFSLKTNNASNTYKTYMEDSVVNDGLPILSFKQFLVIFKNCQKIVKVNKVDTLTLDVDKFLDVLRAYHYSFVWQAVEAVEPEAVEPEAV